MPYGNWSGAHSVGWDRNAPEFGDLAVGDNFQKHSYPFGIIVNAKGERFVDEGADFRNYTYAKYGRVILEQPGQFAWQIFDKKVTHLLRDEYRIRQVTKVTSNTLEELVAKLDDVNADQALATIRAYNAAVRVDIAFDPNVKDGRRTEGLPVPKSNWANTIDTPPFEAYAVSCGITFTFGGLRITNDAQVVDTDGAPMPGPAVAALQTLAVPVPRHRARRLTPELAQSADVIYCMTSRHRDDVVAAIPIAAQKTRCLDPGGDIDDPIGKPVDAYVGCAARLQQLIRERFDELGVVA